MAKKTVLQSDLSGEAISEGSGATVTIKFGNGKRSNVILDVTEAEGKDLGKNGREVARRGRKPAAEASAA